MWDPARAIGVGKDLATSISLDVHNGTTALWGCTTTPSVIIRLLSPRCLTLHSWRTLRSWHWIRKSRDCRVLPKVLVVLVLQGGLPQWTSTGSKRISDNNVLTARWIGHALLLKRGSSLQTLIVAVRTSTYTLNFSKGLCGCQKTFEF